MKILFYIDTLHMGGAARMISLIANNLVQRGYDIGVATNIQRSVVYEIHPNVKLLALYRQDAYRISRIRRLFSLIKSARSIARVESPDVIVTTIPAVSFYVKLATLGLNIPTIFCDVTSYARKDSRFVHFVRYHFYKLADAVTIETENDRMLLGNRLPQKVVINDPLAFDIYRGPEYRENFILAIGPTNEWEIKGFDLLLEAYGRIAQKHPEWKLKIAGQTDQSSLAILYNIINKYNISDQVEFLGFIKDIANVMRSASIFALSSRIEGFSLSIIESISQGCPCVCFKTVGVMTEVTENGTGALIVEDGDVESYAEKLDILISNPQLRNTMSEDGRQFISKYELNHIVDQWVSLFGKVIDEK